MNYAHIYVITEGKKVTASVWLAETANAFARAELHSNHESEKSATTTANNLGDKSPTYYYETLIPQVKPESI